ncbi:MAG TPA: DUF6044 family protein [Actinophytocola sp.]|nr:DUF6044 family protein [Actinophytocola sp.]
MRRPLAARRPRVETVCCVVIAACAIAVVGYRLGASLLGQRVFLGLDLFRVFPPWTELLGQGGVTNFYVFDNLDFFVPAYTQLRERLLAGDLATWSPFVSGGTPLLSLPIWGVLSPARLPYLLLPEWLAPAWAKLADLVLAGGGAYLLLRRLRASRPAALLAALTYPLTGFLLAWASWPQAAVAAAIPALFWAVERFVQERRVRAAAPIAVVVAILLFGGFPAVAGLALYAAGAYLLVRVLADRAGRRVVRDVVRDVGVAAGAVVVGVAASAVQLLPFVHTFLGEVDLSYREAGFDRVEPWRYLLSAVLPDSFAGNHLPVYSGPFNPIEVNAYVGSATLVLAALALLRPARAVRGARTYFAALAAVAVLLVWVQGPLLSWLGALPVFADNPIGRVRALLCFAVAVLAAIGFDAVVRVARGERPVRRVAEAVALVAGVLALGLGGRWAFASFGDQLTPGRDRDLLLAVGGAAVVVALLLAANLRRARWLAVGVVPVVVAVQGLAASGFYWPTGERAQFYATSSVHTYLAEHQGHDRVATDGLVLWPNTTASYGIRTVTGHAFLPPPMKELLTAIDPNAFARPTMSTLTGVDPDSPGLDRLAARFYVTRASAPPPPGLTLAHEADGVAVWARADPLPRIRWASRTRVIADPADRVDTLARVPLPANTVVLDRPGEPTGGTSAQVTVVEDSGDTVRVRVTAQGPGYLVVADNVRTDWVAEVDGQERPIVPADHALGAVHVDAGEHEIALRYSPRGRTTGIALSAAATLVLFAAAIPPRFWRRPRPRATPEGSESNDDRPDPASGVRQ